MKREKNTIIAGLLVACVIFVGCENSTNITAAYITESTSAGSENYGVKITYSEDSRIEDKYTDVQIKFSQKGEIVIWKENQEKFNYTIADNDEWYSMTSIFAVGEGKKDGEVFEPMKEVRAKSYFFNSEQSQNLTLRVVVGDIEQNSTGTGYILVGSEAISSHFTLKINKN